MRIIVGIVAGLVLGGLAQAAEQVYTLRVVHTQEDSIQCAADSGSAGLIAELGADGNLAGDWVAYCVIPVK